MPQLLPPSITLSILLLGCWNSRQAIDPLDIVRLSLSGSLPFLRFATDTADLLDDYKNFLPAFLLTQGMLPIFSWRHEQALIYSCASFAGVPSPSRIYNRSIDVANAISLECPSINAALWLRRYVEELRLGEVRTHTFLVIKSRPVYKIDSYISAGSVFCCPWSL